MHDLSAFHVPFSEVQRQECPAPPAFPGIVADLLFRPCPSSAFSFPRLAKRTPPIPAPLASSPLVDLLLQVLSAEGLDFVVHPAGLLQGRGH